MTELSYEHLHTLQAALKRYAMELDGELEEERGRSVTRHYVFESIRKEISRVMDLLNGGYHVNAGCVFRPNFDQLTKDAPDPWTEGDEQEKPL